MKRIIFLLAFLILTFASPAMAMMHVVWGIFPGTQAMKDAIGAVSANGYTLETTPQKVTRIHAIVPDNYSLAGVVYAARWDGQAPCLTIVVGSVPLINMAFMGWPMVSCTAYATWQGLDATWQASRVAWLISNPQPVGPMPIDPGAAQDAWVAAWAAWNIASSAWLAANPEPLLPSGQ